MKHNILILSIGLAFSNASFAESPFNSSNTDLLDVQNRCIISLSDDIDTSEVTGVVNALARQANASVKHIYKHSIKGFTLNMPCHAAKIALKNEAVITAFEPDSLIFSNKRGKPSNGGDTSTPPPQQVSYGTTRVGGSVDGTGYTAWIIDTGIDLTHPDLNVATERGFSAIRGGMNDENGHGTHVAGIIAANNNSEGSLGVAAGASVVPIRVLNRRGSGSTSGVIAGVDFVAGNASTGDCVNMSLGGGVSTVLDNAVIAAAKESGAFFALAAGNEDDDANNHSPARANGVNIFTISAMDSDDVMAWFSNYGTAVDYAAPGVGIFSLWKNGGTNAISGTSMAAPHACAVLMMTNGVPSTSDSIIDDKDSTPDMIIHL